MAVYSGSPCQEIDCSASLPVSGGHSLWRRHAGSFLVSGLWFFNLYHFLKNALACFLPQRKEDAEVFAACSYLFLCAVSVPSFLCGEENDCIKEMIDIYKKRPHLNNKRPETRNPK